MNSRFSPWLLSLIGAGLLSRQLLLWQQLSSEDLRFGALGAVFLALLIWNKRRRVSLESDPLSTGAGSLLIAIYLVRAGTSPGALFTAVAPVIWGLGLGLLAAGWRGLKQFRREGVVLALLALPFFVRWLLFDAVGYNVSPIVAGAAAALAHALGWPAQSDGDIIHISGRTVTVYQACSGLKSLFLTTGFAVFLLLVFPPEGRLRKAGAILAAWISAFVVNLSRVTMLVILMGMGNEKGFHYWHTQDGALMFEILAMMVFIFIYQFALLNASPAPLKKKTAQ